MLGGGVCSIGLAVLLKDIHCLLGNHVLKKCILPLFFLEGVASASYLYLLELNSSERNYFNARENFHKLGVLLCAYVCVYVHARVCMDTCVRCRCRCTCVSMWKPQGHPVSPFIARGRVSQSNSDHVTGGLLLLALPKNLLSCLRVLGFQAGHMSTGFYMEPGI